MAAKISLISDDELADVGVSRQESEAFVKQHTPGQQVNQYIAFRCITVLMGHLRMISCVDFKWLQLQDMCA